MTEQFEERKKKHHSKSRFGCNTCKRRHLKCDEERPSCLRCLTDFGRCEGYSAPQTWLFEIAKPESDDHTSTTDSSSNASPNSTATDSSTSTSVSGSQTTATPPETVVQVQSADADYNRQKRWAPKSKRGCLTCKKRRVKCDETHPHCRRCLTSNRQCIYPERSVEKGMKSEFRPDKGSKLADGDLLGHAENHFALPALRHIPTIFPHIRQSPYGTQAEHQTFVHWQSRTETCMVISRSFGSFNILGTEIPSAAWSYDCLKHGLLSAASVTASLEKFSTGGGHQQQAVLDAVRHNSLAIRSAFLEKPPPQVVALVAFVFWFMEAWIGSWENAVMHLSSAASICEQAFPRGQVSESVAWYIGTCNDAVPQALRSSDILELVRNIDQHKDDKLYTRILWGCREASAGLAILQHARLKASRSRPKESEAFFDNMLATHQAQMKFLLLGWQKRVEQFQKPDNEATIPPRPVIPLYAAVMEMVQYFIDGNKRFDALVLGVRLKMVQRSLPLFIAGKNVEIRVEAAASIPVKVESLERIETIEDGADDR